MEEETKLQETTVAPEINIKPKTKNNFFKIFLLVILGLLILAGAVYAGMNIGKKQTPPEITPPVAEVFPTSDPTAGWETYKNTKFNFSFMYPSELIYVYDQSDQYSENGISNAMILIQNFDGSKARSEMADDFQVVVYIANKSGQFNLENPQGEQIKTTINGIKVNKSFTTQKWELVPTVYFESSPNKVAVQLSNPQSTNKAWFDQILSTFKFID